MSIGIIVNPASGKDIRRLVAHATVIDNKEKVNIVLRAALGAHAMGVREFLIMPDTFMMGQVMLQSLLGEVDGEDLQARLLEMTVTSSAQDTTVAARLMEEQGVGCVIVLGGDGTSRAAAKSLVNTPILPVSTGTNNVYPSLVEGTVAGLCAAVVDQLGDPSCCCVKDKRIDIYIDGELKDIALVDAVISAHSYAGARAIWNMEEILGVIAVRAHPQNIGFSSMIGCQRTVLPEDDFAYAVTLGNTDHTVLAPVAPGVVERINVSEPEQICVNEEYRFTAVDDCMIALDGEREVRLAKGKTASFRITRNGPWRVDVRKTMEMAQAKNLFILP